MGDPPHMVCRHAVRLAVIAAVAAVAGFTALAVSASRPGDAAYPGANGHIAYAYGESYGYGGGSIWSANADGSAPVMLTNSGSDRSPAYSADGSRIAFERKNGVAAMNADGTGLTQLLEGGGSTSSETRFETEYETSEKPPRVIPVVRIHTVVGKWRRFGTPFFSPDGSQLAVEEGTEDTKFTSICAVEAEGDEKCLEYGSENAFVDYEFECLTCVSRIVTVNSVNGAKVGTVDTAPENDYDSEPAYAADGKIAFARWTPSGSGIFVVNSPGATPTQVTSGYSVWAPDFSPDGSRIAFSHGGELATVGVGGGPVTILPTPAPSEALGSFAGSPAFSPDGSRIAFERTVYFKGKWDYGIDTIAPDGSGLTKVVDRGSAPSWQPLHVGPPPVLPNAKARKGAAKLTKSGRGTVGAIVCGSSPCALKVLSAKLKIGKKSCRAKASAPASLAAGQQAAVKVRVSGKCLAALRKAGKGVLVVRLQVTDGLGAHLFTLRSTLKPPRAKTHKKSRG